MKRWLFAGKKIVSRLFFTLTLPWLVLLGGLIWPEYIYPLTAAVALCIFGAGPLGRGLLWMLSRRYPQLDIGLLPPGEYLIGVAGSGFQQHSRRVPESWFGDNLVIRLTEAGRVAQELDKRGIPYRLCVSMPEHPEMLTDKLTGLTAFFARFGVCPALISVVDTAMDSEEEMEAFQKLQGMLIIVSNSWHVPRLMLAAKLRQYPSLAAPAGQIFHAPKIRPNWDILPTAGSLQNLECAFHEIIGIVELLVKNGLKPQK